jgi:hypothetical protein
LPCHRPLPGQRTPRGHPTTSGWLCRRQPGHRSHRRGRCPSPQVRSLGRLQRF